MLKTISAVIVALATGVVGAVLGYMSRDREMDVKMVEIAVGILSQEPKENIAPAREWAVNIITLYSGAPMPESVRKALLGNQISIGGLSIQLSTNEDGTLTLDQSQEPAN